MEFTFTLRYQVLPQDTDMDVLTERLAEAGCDDALIGVGQPGRLALEFVRESSSADEAMRNAMADVYRAIPNAHLIEAIPGVAGLEER
jgi:hypothetical protein